MNANVARAIAVACVLVLFALCLLYTSGIGVLVHERRVFAPRTILIGGILLTIAVAVFSSRFDGFGTYALDWYRVVAATPGMAMIVYGAVTLEEQARLSVAAALVRMGDASYTTYLWHGMLLGTFTAVVAHFRPCLLYTSSCNPYSMRCRRSRRSHARRARRSDGSRSHGAYVAPKSRA